MAIQTKHLHLSVKANGDDGSFDGYGSVFGNTDSYGDIVCKGAFTKTLADRASKVKLLWQHNQDQPIGIFTSIAEDDTGLKLSGQINLQTQQGAEAYALLKQGALDGMSIGYQTIQSDYDPKLGANLLKEVKLYEVSLVTFPANEEATVTDVKSMFEDLTQEQRQKVALLINSFKTSLSSDEPPTAEASDGKHSDAAKADKEPAEEPQSDPEIEALHSLEVAATTLERLVKTITRK